MGQSSVMTEDGAELVASTEVGLARSWAAHAVGGDEWMTWPTPDRWVATAYVLGELRDYRETGIPVGGLLLGRVMRAWRRGEDPGALLALLADLDVLRGELVRDHGVFFAAEAVPAVDEVMQQCRAMLAVL